MGCADLLYGTLAVTAGAKATGVPDVCGADLPLFPAITRDRNDRTEWSPGTQLSPGWRPSTWTGRAERRGGYLKHIPVLDREPRYDAAMRWRGNGGSLGHSSQGAPSSRARRRT